jgi:membrane-associated phospholipid phosphatase
MFLRKWSKVLSRLRTLSPKSKYAMAMALLLNPYPARAEEPFPYEMKTGTEVGLVLTAAGLFTTGWLLDQDFRVLIPEEVDALEARTLNFLDRPATGNWSPGAGRASDWLIMGQRVAPLGLNFSDQGSRQPLKVTAMYLETLAVSNGLAYLLKNAFNRTRPFVYNDDPAIPADLKTSRTARKSFPSGHTTDAFATMVFLASVYEQLNPDDGSRGTVWAVCLTSAAVTGGLRVAAGRHFVTDVLAGAALGSLVGYVVPRLHEVGDGPPGAGSGAGLALSYGFAF